MHINNRGRDARVFFRMSTMLGRRRPLPPNSLLPKTYIQFSDEEVYDNAQHADRSLRENLLAILAAKVSCHGR